MESLDASADDGRSAREGAAREQAMDWLLRLEAAPRDAELRAQFEAWLAESEANRKAFGVMGHTWRRLGEVRPNPAAVPAAKPRLRPLVAAAAMALAACVALYFFPTLQMRVLADHMTGVAELREVVLEDGSVVHLDAGSAISVTYGAAGRDVALLAGQAFFDVAPLQGRPFRVRSGDVTVTVTGTAFSVRSSPQAVSVDVQSGRVEVSAGSAVSAVLTRGQRVVVDRASGGIVRGEVAPEQVASWRSRRLIVHDATLDDVVEELGRHHAGLILLPDRKLARQLVTGVFDLTRPVEALTAVAESQNGKLMEITPYLLVISAR
jgi:transmembrane sensor